MTWVKTNQSSTGVLTTIWDAGGTVWDSPSPFTIWDKDVSIIYVKQKAVS